VQINRTYAVQFNSSMGTQAWSQLSNISAKSSVRTIIITDPVPATNQVRFYRAVTP